MKSEMLFPLLSPHLKIICVSEYYIKNNNNINYYKFYGKGGGGG